MLLLGQSYFSHRPEQEYSVLLDRIDAKLSKWAKDQLRSVRFGLGKSFNKQRYEDLIAWREVVTGLFYCSDCLKRDKGVVFAKVASLLRSC